MSGLLTDEAATTTNMHILSSLLVNTIVRVGVALKPITKIVTTI